VNVPHQLLIATSNDGKHREISQLLSDLPISLCDLRNFPAIKPISETGASFLENASLKAVGYAVQTGLLTLADDSGLEVDALGGEPGVRSARFAGEFASDTDRIEALMAALNPIEESKRRARFVSAVVIAASNGEILSASSGICEGRISLTPRGAGGFGYDPLFIPSGYEVTFAQLKPEVKNQISHRASALAGAHIYLRRLTAPSVTL
jgi:XTP/dITP diphosphohydrolase